MKRVTSYAHHFLINHLSNTANICDLTCGNGNDTLFCAQHFKSVISFDIQEEAIMQAKQKCSGHKNIVFIQQSHELLDSYILQSVDAYLFNSGYLPKSNSHRVTHAKSSITAFDKSIRLLNAKGYLCLIFYRKHDGGNEEYIDCLSWLEKQPTIRIIKNSKNAVKSLL